MKLIKKRKNAGFSLVELLVTILIISIVLGIGTYLVINTINNSKEKTKEITYENIKTSARLYAEENNSEITWEKQKNTEITCIPISYLIDQGYLKKSDVESVDYTSVIVTKDSNNRSILKEELDTKGICDETVVDIPTSKKYCLNTTYNGNTQTLTKEPDEGYTFTDNKGIDAKKYIINAELKDDYRWEDGTHDTKTITCYIGSLIKYHGNGADESDIKIQKCIDDNCIVEKNTYTKLGHTFNSWNTTAAGTGMTITEGEKITLNEANLYAKWDPVTYTITLDSEGASVAETKAIYLSYGQGIYLNDTLETKFLIGNNSIKIPTKKGYIFDGYYSGDNGTGTQLIDANGKRLEALTDTYATKDITIYAKWIPNTITITLKENGSNASTTGYSVSLSTSNSNDTATFNGTTSGATITFSTTSTNALEAGKKYYIWAGKSSNNKTTKIYSGVSFTATTNTTQTTTINYYGLTLAKGTGISDVKNGGTSTTSAVQYLYNSSSPQSIVIDATLNSGYTWNRWTKTSGTNLSTFTATKKGQSVKMGAGAITLTASATYTLTPTITRSDYNTFTYTASGAGAYYVSKSSTAPSAGNNAASSTFALNTWTTATSTGNLYLTAGTYYVYVKSAATGGTVSSNKASITAYTVTRQQGTGTTLITRYDGTSSSTGTSLTNSTLTVLSGTKVWVESSANTGYKLPELERNNSYIYNGSLCEITDTVTFSSSATLMTYTISYNCNGNCTNLPSSQTKTHGIDLTLSSTIPIREGYKFVGWGIETTSTEGTYNAGDTYTTNSDITLFAVWKKTLSDTVKNAFSPSLSEHLGTFTTEISTTKYSYRYDVLFSPSSDVIELVIDHSKNQTIYNRLYIYQYQGANPNNYVNFNGELWRIISTTRTPTDSTNLPEDISPNLNKVKLIRAEPLDYYQWDTNGSIWWEESSLYTTLEAYYMKIDVTDNEVCNDGNSEKYGCNFTKVGLNDNAKSLLSMGTWDESIRDITKTDGTYYTPAESLHLYYYLKWTAQSYVGLISPEDYVFSADIYENYLYDDTINNYNLYTDYNWLYDSITIPNRTTPSWTINTQNLNSEYITVISSNGSITTKNQKPTFVRLVTPVVYLDENVVVMSGDGSENSPYEIAIGY